MWGRRALTGTFLACQVQGISLGALMDTEPMLAITAIRKESDGATSSVGPLPSEPEAIPAPRQPSPFPFPPDDPSIPMDPWPSPLPWVYEAEQLPASSQEQPDEAVPELLVDGSAMPSVRGDKEAMALEQGQGEDNGSAPLPLLSSAPITHGAKTPQSEVAPPSVVPVPIEPEASAAPRQPSPVPLSTLSTPAWPLDQLPSPLPSDQEAQQLPPSADEQANEAVTQLSVDGPAMPSVGGIMEAVWASEQGQDEDSGLAPPPLLLAPPLRQGSKKLRRLSTSVSSGKKRRKAKQLVVRQPLCPRQWRALAPLLAPHFFLFIRGLHLRVVCLSPQSGARVQSTIVPREPGRSGGFIASEDGSFRFKLYTRDRKYLRAKAEAEKAKLPKERAKKFRKYTCEMDGGGSTCFLV